MRFAHPPPSPPFQGGGLVGAAAHPSPLPGREGPGVGARSAPFCYGAAMKSRRVPLQHTQQARALRNEPTPEERTLWRLLSRDRPKFTRQLPIGPYKADLACRQARLVVEV